MSVVRYERATPGELIHPDIKKLGRIEAGGYPITGDPHDRVRGAGWEGVHVCIDERSRVSHAKIRPGEKRESHRLPGGDPCQLRRLGRQRATSHDRQRQLLQVGHLPRALRHLRTKPAKTNGKDERFVQSARREWAYPGSYTHSDERTAALTHWLHRYNWQRPHRLLHRLPPISGINLRTTS